MPFVRYGRAMTPTKVTAELLRAALPNTLQGTNFEGLGERYEGKVRDNYTVEGGWEPLLIALRYGQADNARKMILKGANVNAQNSDNWSALMLALSYDQPENARLLLQKGADTTVQSKDGETALTLARKKNYFDIIRVLEARQPAGR